jgi:hypothetical protein
MYFPENRNIPEEWLIICNQVLLNFHAVTIHGIDGLDGREIFLMQLMDHLDNPLNSRELGFLKPGAEGSTTYYLSWIKIREAVLKKYQNVIKQIIDTPISAYS